MARILRRSSFVRGGRSSGRLTEWQGSPNNTAETDLPANTFLLFASLTAAELAKRPFTITRTVGSLWVRSDQRAADEQPFGALGFIVVSEKAVATGATALPDPITEEASDEWFAYRSFAVNGGPIDGRNMMEFQYDSRAQRKVQDGEDIAVMITNASAANGLTFIHKFRLLIKVA